MINFCGVKNRKVLVFFISLVSLTIGNFVNADVYSSNTMTVTHESTGVVTNYTVLTVTKPIVVMAVYMRQSGVASDTIISCGGVVIAKNYAKDLVDVSMNYTCKSDIKINKTGNDSSFTIINYRTADEEPLQSVVVVSGNVFIPNFELFLGMVLFFGTFFALIFYFKKWIRPL